MAVSTSFAGAKLEALLLKSSSANATTSSSRAVASSTSFYKPIRTRRALFQRGVRCEVASSDVSVQNDQAGAGASNVSALEQLKTSAADSMSLSHFTLLFNLEKKKKNDQVLSSI